MRLVGAGLIATALGCSSFLHFKDPSLQAIVCAVGGDVLPELEAIAAAEGVPVAFVIAAYESACATAGVAKATQQQAHDAGIAGARAAAKAARRVGATFHGEVKP